MNDPKQLLLRAAAIASGQQHLGELTGLSRLAIDTHRLQAGDSLALPGGGERFLYVLEGAGTVTAKDEVEAVGTGDFVALQAAESATVLTDDTLTVLSGRLCSGGDQRP
jgi:uncharacterized cupin superfamily protein